MKRDYPVSDRITVISRELSSLTLNGLNLATLTAMYAQQITRYYVMHNAYNISLFNLVFNLVSI